ncbi:MAG: GNAT family N-acetyltransferase [Chloroflexi bacterium]|nr:GNAT family N-acetyltransferase [Chloroflexota bacterium]MYK61762.1 GNAT family N-acetyltransferase [Chloroflexota bacterium]
MEIRTITRHGVPELFRILRAAGPHGHREWPLTDEATLVATLDNSRLDPDLGRWSIGYEDDMPVGYALVEPELNIGRILVGLATVEGRDDSLGSLLQDGVTRAQELSDQDRFEIHVAVRDTESKSIVDALEAAGFSVVRTVLKMRVDVSQVELPDSPAPPGFIVRDADMSDAVEATSVTDLHNACFSSSWGFSPNTVEEIADRTAADADRNGFAPIVVSADASDGKIVGYNWITLSEGDGRVEMVGVHPSMRGKRLGWTIFNAGVERLIAHGATALVLDVDSENPPARRIYESAGYRTYSEVSYYGLDVVKS